MLIPRRCDCPCGNSVWSIVEKKDKTPQSFTDFLLTKDLKVNVIPTAKVAALVEEFLEATSGTPEIKDALKETSDLLDIILMSFKNSLKKEFKGRVIGRINSNKKLLK